MPPGNLDDWLAWHLLPGLGPLQKRRALERIGDAGEAAWRAPARLVAAAAEAPAGAAERVREGRAGLAARVRKELEAARALGLALVHPGHDDYPAALVTLPDPPPLLYVRGRLAAARVRVAVVGARRATAYGRRVAVGLGAALAARGIEVVSGGARGVDACAHRGALEGGGTTVVVQGAGFRHLYPPEHAELFEEIASSGAVISEFPLDTEPFPGNFPRRNRLISGLAAAVVVVEAALRSGSLLTAAHALEQGREVMAVPGPVHSSRSEGCHRLIQQGAKLIHHTDDLVEELSPMYRGALCDPPGPGGTTPEEEGGATPDEQATLGLLDEAEPLHIDALVERAPFGIARLQAALFGLLVRGDVEELSGHRYLRSARRRG